MGFVIFLTLLHLLFSVYDGEEYYNSKETGAEAPEYFPDTVATNFPDYDAGEEPDP
jgi:hypothetical protein